MAGLNEKKPAKQSIGEFISQVLDDFVAQPAQTTRSETVSNPIPLKPLAYREPVWFTPDPGVRWDPRLSEVIVENNMVMGLACGYIKPLVLEEGDTYYRLVDAAFIDEIEARGQHVISVDVVDEDGNRINGARVWHGWPTQKLPEYDERVQATIFGAQLAEWPLYADFDAWQVPGPYWVQPADGKADLFWGAGLPWKRHVSFALVFKRTLYHAEQPPAATLSETLLAAGEAAQVIQFNPQAALQKAIFAAGFVPNSPEFQVTFDGDRYVAQRAENLASGEVRIYYVLSGNWGGVEFVTRP